MYFEDYLGRYNEESKGNYKFFFKNSQYLISVPCFIVPPVYDISFKSIFFNDDDYKTVVKDFLNSILYPQSKSIEELDFLPKEILSKSHLKHNKGTKIVDNAYLIKIAQHYPNSDEVTYKEIILDLEMEKRNLSQSITEKCFDYGTMLRNGNNYKETWVIALCIDKTKKPQLDKGSKTYISRQLNINNFADTMNYVKIYEIYLNCLYNDSEPKSVINNEKISSIGKEWIKLFCLSLWCNSFEGDNINYCFPSDINFKGREIKKAFEILRDINQIERGRIKIQERGEEQKYKEKYDEGYNKGEKDGYNRGEKEGFNNGYNRGEKEGFNNGYNQGETNGFNNGYNQGETNGFNRGVNLGYEKFKMNSLDIFYNNFLSNKSLENIEMIGPISSRILHERYGMNEVTDRFALILKNKGLLV